MGAATKIEWTATVRPDGTVSPGYTFNPWWGCVKVSPGCANCYAEAFDRRTHGTAKHTDARGVVREPHWGKDAPRRFFGDKHWRQPLAWNRAAELAGERRRVFCASMADVFEDRPDLVEPRARLFSLIDATPSLDWLLLTKRPENIGRLATPWCVENGALHNVWLGTTVENQEQADLRIPHLLRVPAAVRFLSVEPLLGPVDLTPWLDEEGYDPDATPDVVPLTPIDWVIVGGESGPGARPMHPEWARSLRDQCRDAGVPFFFKQEGAWTQKHPAGFHAVTRNRYSHETITFRPDGSRYRATEPDTLMEAGMVTLYRTTSHNADPAEWPEDLRVREFPGGGA